jgi:hypothetical protein
MSCLIFSVTTCTNDRTPRSILLSQTYHLYTTCHIYSPLARKNNCQMIHQISANITLHNGIEKGGKLLRQGVVTTITHLLVTSCTKVRTPLGILLSQTYHLLTTCHSFLHVNEDGSTM